MSKGQIIVGSLVVIIFGIVMSLYMLKPEIMPKGSQEWAMLVGALITNFGVVMQWFFGSSKGSADKTALLTKINNPK